MENTKHRRRSPNHFAASSTDKIIRRESRDEDKVDNVVPQDLNVHDEPPKIMVDIRSAAAPGKVNVNEGTGSR